MADYFYDYKRQARVAGRKAEQNEANQLVDLQITTTAVH